MRRFVQRNGPVVRVERSEIPSPPIHGCSTRTLLPSIRTTILRRSARSWLERADRDPIGRGRASPSIGVGAKLFCASQQIQGAKVLMSPSGQFLPRYLTECAAALPHKAAAPAVRRRGSYGPISDISHCRRTAPPMAGGSILETRFVILVVYEIKLACALSSSADCCGRTLPSAKRNQASKIYHAEAPARPGIGSDIGNAERTPIVARQPDTTNNATFGARNIQFS
jgi:hypothetical protein